MRTLVIPDVHQHTSAVAELVNNREYDEVVFLGDWVDSLQEPPAVSSFGETCDFLVHLILEHPRREDFVFLVGNHDLQYIYHNKDTSHRSVRATSTYYCSGFTKTKVKKWRSVFFDHGHRDAFFIKHFRLAYRSQGITFSHAGIMPQLLGYGQSVEDFIVGPAATAWQNFRDVSHPKNYILSAVSPHRGGSDRIPGVLWCDWRCDFAPSEVVGRQIMGHTTVSHPEVMSAGTPAESWNLDAPRAYAIVQDGEVLIRHRA